MRGGEILDRSVVWLAAAVCLLFAFTLRDVPAHPLVWRPSTDAPLLPEDVGDRDASLTVSVKDGDGEAREGTLVRVFVVIDDVVYLAGSARTGPDGTAHFDALPRGEAWVIAEQDGLARSSSRVVLESGERRLELTLAAAESFEVVVVDPLQRPIRGVTVTLYSSDPLEHVQKTDERGLARFESLPAPPYAVDVVAAGFDGKFIGKLGRDDSPLFVKLSRLGGLEIKVIAPDQRPEPGATVTVAGSSLWPARSATTNEKGRVTISGLSKGFYDLRAEQGDLVSKAIMGVMLEEGEIKEVELELVPGRYVDVLVTDGDGDDAPPIENADVALVEGGVSSFPRYGRTNATGHVVLGPIAGEDVAVSARAEGYVPRSAVALEEGESEVQIGLLRGGTLHGEVVDEFDFPVDGATLEVVGVDIDGMPIVESTTMAGFAEDHFAFALPGATPLVPAGELGVMPVIPDIPFESHGGLVVPRTQRTGAAWVTGRDGTFTLDSVTPGQIRVVARHPSFVEGISEMVVLPPGGVADVRIVLRHGGALEGRVVEENGSPVPGARVEVAAVVGTLERVTFTADDGTFAFAALPDEVVISVSRADSWEHVAARVTVEVPPDERREIEIVLPEERESVRIRVADEGGYPIDRAEIQASSLTPGVPLVRTLFTDDNGEAELADARGLPLRFVVRRRGHAPGAAEVDPAPDVVELVMSPAYSASGEVWGSSGFVADAQLTLLTATGSKNALSDGEGRFTLTDLAQGTPRLLVQADGHVPTEIDVTIAGAPDRVIDLGRIELEEGGIVEGKVVDDMGDPVAGARVALGRVPTYLPLGELPLGIAATDRTGRFRLTGLAQGTAVIEAYSRGFARGSVSVRVVAGDTEEGVTIELEPDPDAEVTRVGAQASLAVTLSETDEGRRVILFEHVPLLGEAHYAGILPGDHFLAYDGIPIRSLEQARESLNGPISEDMVLTLGRGELTWRVRVRRERIR